MPTSLSDRGLPGPYHSDPATSPCEDDDEDPAKGVLADRDEPFLVWNIIEHRDRELIVKHRRCIGEVDSMLPPIRGGLSRIPFEIHRSSVCTTVHPVKEPPPRPSHGLGGLGRASDLERGRRSTDIRKVVASPRISAGSTVGIAGPVSARDLEATETTAM